MTEVNALVSREDSAGHITLHHELDDDSFLPVGEVQIAAVFS